MEDAFPAPRGPARPGPVPRREPGAASFDDDDDDYYPADCWACEPLPESDGRERNLAFYLCGAEGGDPTPAPEREGAIDAVRYRLPEWLRPSFPYSRGLKKGFCG